MGNIFSSIHQVKVKDIPTKNNETTVTQKQWPNNLNLSNIRRNQILSVSPYGDAHCSRVSETLQEESALFGVVKQHSASSTSKQQNVQATDLTQFVRNSGGINSKPSTNFLKVSFPITEVAILARLLYTREILVIVILVDRGGAFSKDWAAPLSMIMEMFPLSAMDRPTEWLQGRPQNVISISFLQSVWTTRKTHLVS